jgi:hypothetical protein
MGKVHRLGWGLAAAALVLLPRSGFGAPEIPSAIVREWLFCNNAGWQDLQRGKYDRAEKQFIAAIKLIRPYDIKDQRLLARSYGDLARVLYHQGRFAQAEPLARWSLQVREAHPRVKPEAVFQSLFVLGKIEIALAHYGDAETHLRKALAIQERTLGAEHGELVLTLDALAGVLSAETKYDEAETLYKRTLDIEARTLPPSSLEIADTSEHYAATLRAQDRLTESEFFEAKARAIRAEAAEAARQAAEAASEAARARTEQARARSLRGFD